ncbi:TetR/AcrR family transcriptional regulator [Marinobacterium arenosum]|uniref:TetR/AcrR family transcriptional regulator n=1 Tax=Marinobacterium arenosum TaxID=2862496 RepID=UPI001C98D0DA|nr:TetR/AcrR family transcriptional regulator [Marinobacterium arenosum]MBY4678482.1 TetR/AcrR family transcriptional regulator [Marinobacterium arenosum]
MVNIAKFDRQEVVSRAMRLFWQKGFKGTSTRDLQQVINMHPGSIYAAFGSKAGLYREALDYYAGEMAARLQSLIQQHGSVLEGFQAFFRQALLDQQHSPPSNMCMLVKTAVELQGKEVALCEQAKLRLAETEQLFTRLLDQARANGELPAETSTTELARYLQIQMMGLRSYKACSAETQTIEAMIERLF